jgi:hypothetical protein
MGRVLPPHLRTFAVMVLVSFVDAQADKATVGPLAPQPPDSAWDDAMRRKASGWHFQDHHEPGTYRRVMKGNFQDDDQFLQPDYNQFAARKTTEGFGATGVASFGTREFHRHDYEANRGLGGARGPHMHPHSELELQQDYGVSNLLEGYPFKMSSSSGSHYEIHSETAASSRRSGDVSSF